MERSLFSARILSRTSGPPCSNIVTFSVERNPGVTYCAYAVSDGAIIVQQNFQRFTSVTTSANSARGASAANPAADAAADPRVSFPSSSGIFAPVLLIDPVALDYGSATFGRLCWGGGPEALLAAATKQHVYFFSLLPFFLGPAAALPSHQMPSLPLPSTAFALTAIYRTAMPASALAFTQDVRGLLLTDTGNNVTMLRLVPKETVSQGKTGAAAVTTAGSRPQPQQIQQQAGVDGPPAVLFSVHEAWRVRADATHTLAAASQDCYSPCATSTAGVGAGCSPHKVTIWWPVAGEVGAEHDSAGYHHDTPAAVGAEIVRHPVRVTSLEWSPPLAGSARSRGPAAGGGDDAAGTGGTQLQLAAAPAAPSRAPALMTLGADWVIRIYVEVVMQNMLPPELAAAAQGMSMSQFCLTLVIEPPGLNLSPSSRPGMRACWARPLGSGGGGGDAVGAAALTADAGGEGAGGEAQNEQGGGGGAGGGGGDGGSRLQWIVASVGTVAVDEAELHDVMGPPVDEAVCVWAVDGLSAVVLSGMPRGAVSSAKTAASPKAVLWGTEPRTVSWLQPAKLLPAVPSAMRPGDYTISAYVTYPGGMPLLWAADSCVGMLGTYAEVRSYQVTPTATTMPGTAGQTATFLRVGSLARQVMTGSPETISTMLIHPAADVALLRDRTGGVALWALSPLCELPIGVAPAAASASRVLLAAAGQLAAAAWMSCCSRLPPASLPSTSAPSYGSPDGDGAGGMLAYIACIHSGRLLVYAVLLPAAVVAASMGDSSGDGGAAMAAAAAAAAVQGSVGWGAMFVSEVLRVDLPPGVTAVRQLFEVSYEECSLDLAAATLVALGSRAAPGGPEPDEPAVAATTATAHYGGVAAPRSVNTGTAGWDMSYGPAQQGPHQDVWLTWRLQLQPACASTGLRAASLVSEHVDDIAAALAVGSTTACGSSLSFAASGPTSPSPLAPVVSCCCTSLPTPVDSDVGSSGGGGSASDVDSSSGGDGGGSSSGRVPRLMSGTSDGHVQFWRPAQSAVDGLGGGGLELVQVLPCRASKKICRPNSCTAPSPRRSGPGANRGGGGMVVAVALDEMSGYAAAATTCGVGDEEALFVWCLKEEAEVKSGSADAAIGGGKADGDGESYTAQYELAAVVPVRDTVSSLSWLAASGLSASLAVGYASGRVGLLIRDRTGEWEEVASYSGAAAVAAFGSARGGAVVMAAGNHIVCFSNALDCNDPDERPELTIAAVAADFAGPLPPYHPGAVHALVAKGRLATACRVLRRLLTWLREGSHLTDALVAPAATNTTASENRSSEVPVPGADGSGSARVAQRIEKVAEEMATLRPPLVVDFSELLSDGLTSSRGLAAFQQVLAAPVATATLAAAPAPPLPPQLGGAAVVGMSGAGVGSGAATSSAATMFGTRRAAVIDDASAPLRTLLGGGSGGSKLGPTPQVTGVCGLETGALDMSAFGDFGGMGSTIAAQPRAASPSAASRSALETGALDMSAFGDLSGMGSTIAAPQVPSAPPSVSRSTLETGTLDMSSFSGLDGFAVTPKPAGSDAAPPPSHTGLETGMLRLSTFGGFGGSSRVVAAPPPPQQHLVHSPLETGTLDVSAFGDWGGAGTGAAPQPPEGRAPPPNSALETGTLDMSAFGSLGFGGHDPPAPAAPSPPPPAVPVQQVPQPQSPYAALETGMLDMSAFGDFTTGFSYVPQPPPPPPPLPQPPHPPPPHPPPPPPPPSPSPPTPGDEPIHSGMLDMSAFKGLDSMASAPPQEDPQPHSTDWDRTAPTVTESAHLASISASSAMGMARSSLSAFARPTLHEDVRSALGDGQVGVGGSSGGSGGAAASPAPARTASSAAHIQPLAEPAGIVGSNRTGSSSLLFTPAATLPAMPSQSSGTATASMPVEGTGPSADTSGAEGGDAVAWVLFPRVPEPVTPADPSLPDLLLTAGEVSELHRLLGQDPPSVASGASGSGGGGAVLDTLPSMPSGPEAGLSYTSSLPRGADCSGTVDGAVIDAVSALTALGLTPEDGAELCRLAVALSRRSVGPHGAGGTGGGAGTTDVTVGLDFAAREFLVQARLAAAGAQAAASASAGRDDGAFAAAVNKLFRPVSVSRSAGRPYDTPYDTPSPLMSFTAPPAAAATTTRAAMTPGGSGSSRPGSAAPAALGPRAPCSFASPVSPLAMSHGQLSQVGRPGSRAWNTPGSRSHLVQRSRSVRSALSVLSFSSLPDSVGGGPEGRRSGAWGDEQAGGGEGSWWRVCGMLPGLDWRSCLAALASGTQGQLVEAVLPSIPWVAAEDEEASAAPEGRHAGMMGGGAGSAGSKLGLGGAGASAPPRPSLSWPLLRKAGAGFWLADPRVVREQAEALAKVQYARRKEPYDCALLYLALGRKALLISLFRQASNLKIADFLLRDFNQQEPRRSAAKNAFALLGQHRYELAAAFFILAGQPYDAVSVLVRERRDLQLALFVTRLLDPPGAALGGPLARRLIEQELMPLAVASGDPCTIATLECLAGEPTRAVLHLLVSRGRNGADASGGADGAGDGSVGLKRPDVDGAVLDYCLRVGVQYLSGKAVPLSCCTALRRLALETSRALERAGLAAASLEALLVAAALQRPPAAAATSMYDTCDADQEPRLGLLPALARRYSRLLAACLSYSLLEAQQRQQGQLESVHAGSRVVRSYEADSCVAAVAAAPWDRWQREAREALERLAPVLGPRVDENSVLRLLARHISALQRVRQQPVVPPELLVARPLRPSALTAPGQAQAQAPSRPPHHHNLSNQHEQHEQHEPYQPQQVKPLQQQEQQQQLLQGRSLQQPHAAAPPSSSAPSASTTPAGGSSHHHHHHPSSSLHAAAAVGNSAAAGVSAAAAGAAAGGPDSALRSPGTSAHGLAGGGGGGRGSAGGGFDRLSPESSSGSLFGAPSSPLPTQAGSPDVSQRSAASRRNSFSGSGRPPVGPSAPAAGPALARQTPPTSPLPYGGTPLAVDGTSRRGAEGSTGGAGSGSGGSTSTPPGWGVFEAPWDILAVEGDRCRSVTVMRGRGPDDNGQLPFAVALAKSGLLGGVLGPPALAPTAKAAGPSSLFLGLMQSVLHHVRWTPDPWAMMSGDFADESGAVGGVGGGGPGIGGGLGGATAAGGGGSVAAGGRQPGLPPYSGGGGGSGVGGPGNLGGTASVTLASHPERDIYLSGSNNMLVYQWRFGEQVAQSAYVPCLEPHYASGAAAAAVAAAARSRSASGGGSAAAAVASALDLHASHWCYAAALSYSTPSGSRFAGIGEGGLVAMWRTDVLGPGGLGYADWTHHCVSKHGRGLCYVGDSSSQLLVVGQGDRGGLVGWWDSLAPPTQACVAEIRGRKAVPTALALLRPDAGGVLVFGDESGELVATDLRMMSAREFIWTLPRAHAGAVTAIAQWGPNATGVLRLPAPAPPPQPGGPQRSAGGGGSGHHQHASGGQHGRPGSQTVLQARISNLFVSGGKDGSLALVDISSGKIVSCLERAHCTTRTGLPGLLAAAAASASGGSKPVDRTIARRSRPAAASGVAVGGLFCMPDGGVVSCGADGVVRYHPLAPQLLDLK